MLFTPRPHQKLISDFILENRRCAIWSYMGSGKTSATLDAIETILAVEGSKVLIVAPKLVARDVWPQETEKFEQFSGMRCAVLIGSKEERESALSLGGDIFSVSFDLIPWLAAHPKCPLFGMIVVDESSKLRGFRGSFQRHPKTGKIYFRSGGTKRAAEIARLAWKWPQARFVELTGTPTPKGLINLWAQLWFIDRGRRLGNTFTAFTKRWFEVGYNGYDLVAKEKALEEILSRVSDVVLTINANDLENPVVIDIAVTLPKEAMKRYLEIKKSSVLRLEGDATISAVNAGARLSKCSQIANGAVYDEEGNTHIVHDAKLDALERIIEENDGASILVAYEFKHDLDRLKKRFPQGIALDGKASTVKDWNAGKIPLMFLHPASAGHGNNFQYGGNILVFFGFGWDLELYQQVIERIGPARQKASGFQRPVYVYRIVAKATVDEQKLKILEGKASAQDAVREILVNSLKEL